MKPISRTSGAARFLGKQNEFGRIAVGMAADLILLEANPLLDVRNASRRVGVIAVAAGCRKLSSRATWSNWPLQSTR